jgi:hypothetical protein
MKMLRLLRANRMFSRLEARFAVDYSQLQLYAYLAMLLLLMHWLACGCEQLPDGPSASATHDSRLRLTGPLARYCLQMTHGIKSHLIGPRSIDRLRPH